MNKFTFLFITVSSLSLLQETHQQCDSTPTTVVGSAKPGEICAGTLIFEENFDSLDTGKWKREVTLGGGGNGEFQWYTNDEENSKAENGVLKIIPTLTSDFLGGDGALSSQTIDLGDSCTNPINNGCKRTGTPDNILNPIRSARLQTSDSLAFKYGRVEVKAKLPAGDWLWPAIWMLPKDNAYGDWPRSGEIDIMESRGNRELIQDGTNIGVQQVASTLHWGPDPNNNGFMKTHWTKNKDGLNEDFHTYEVIWDESRIAFKVDGEEIGGVSPPDGGFWELGQFQNENIWAGGSKMAPFDKEFYLILNLAVGGTNSYFPDNIGGKPWSNGSPKAATDFWNGKDQWLNSWNLGKNEDSFFQIDYVKIYAL